MTEWDNGSLRPQGAALTEDVNVVAGSSGDVKLLSAGIPGDAIEAIRDLQHLPLLRRIHRDVVHKNVLIRSGINLVSCRVVVAVVAAGQDEERLPIGTRSSGNGLADHEAWKRLQIRIQSVEGGAGCRGGSDFLSGRKLFG